MNLMKRIFALIVVAVSLHSSGVAQYSFRVFPAGVTGDPFADTLLNTKAVLKMAGIRQVNSFQTSGELTKTFDSKSVHLDREGRIENITCCFTKIKTSGFTFCLQDTLIYGSSGFMEKIISSDSKGNIYGPILFVHRSATELKIVQDSIVSHEFFNDKGQLIALRRTLHTRELESTRFYYNADGLLDSTHNAHWGTFIFKRRRHRNEKLVEMNNKHFRFSWAYNSQGQCVRQTVVSKDRPEIVRDTKYKGDIKTLINYFYNPDGTLSKVITKRNDIPAYTTEYSYLKF